MAKKIQIKFDWKKLLLERGEYIALGAAGFLLLIFLIIGVVRGATSGSAAGNAEELQKLSQSVNTRLVNARPTPEDAPPPDKDAKEYVAIHPIDAAPYRTAAMFDVPRQTDTKRRNPRILSPDEFRVQPVLARLRSYDLQMDRTTGKPTKVTIVTGGDGGDGGMMGSGPKVGDQKGYNGALGSSGKGSSGMPPGMPPGTSEGGRFGYNQTGPGAGVPQGGSIKVVPVDQLDKYGSAVFAEKVWAKPMIIIAGTFPYKAQVEEFQRALRMYSPRQVLGDVNNYGSAPGMPMGMPMGTSAQATPLFKFEGVVLERMTLGADGKPARLPNGKEATWELIPHESHFRQVVMVTGRRFEEEPSDLPPQLLQISDQMLMGLPIQFGENGYPKVMSQLKNAQASAKAIEKEGAKLLAPKKSPFDGDDFKPYGNSGTTGAGMDPMGPGMGPGTGAMPPGTGPKGGGMGPGWDMGAGGQPLPEAFIPDHCVFRILDTDPRLEPGKTYKYRVRVRMANPNYSPTPEKRTDTYPHFAKDEFLVSEPTEIGPTAILPPDMHFYAVDQMELETERKYRQNNGKNWSEGMQKGKAFLQVHRWLDVYYPDLKNTRIGRTVGDWSVAERMGVFRGEFVRRDIDVEVPEKPLDHASFILASNPRNKAAANRHLIPVTFGDDSVLVDFDEAINKYTRIIAPAEEGKPPTYAYINDKATTEVLIFTADGRVIAHNGADDADDEGRKKRLESWRENIEGLRKNTKPNQGGGGVFGGGT